MNERFLEGATWGFPGAAVEHIETHAAHVFLVGPRAFKIKKAVRLPYLDFSTLDRRRAVIAHEFEVNRPYAPDIYLGVDEVEGEPVLVMRRFASRDVLGAMIARGQISDELAKALAAMAAEAHRIAPRAAIPGAHIMTGLGAQLSTAFTAAPDIFQSSDTLEFHAFYHEALKRLGPLLDRRSELGLVRRCHGDMHSGNIVVISGRPTLFDAIEFSEKIATIDVLYDLAFLLMDLLHHGRARAANLVLNHYLNSRRAAEDLSGLAALPLFLATRAGVRALVTADLIHELPAAKSLRERGQALDYFRASIAFLKPPRPALMCIGGLSGTGKSTVATTLAPEAGSCGAIHIRSDVERKALAGVGEAERLPGERYGKVASLQVYHAMLMRAEQALMAGHSVILDAVFADPAERNAAAELARRQNVLFQGFWLEAPAAVMKTRVVARVNDASDATASVVDQQLNYDVGTMYWTRIDASGSPVQTAVEIRRRLPSASGGRA